MKALKSNAVARYLKKYEYGLVHDILDEKLVQILYSRYLLGKRPLFRLPSVGRLYTHRFSERRYGALRRYFRKKPIEFEIVKNIRFNPKDKISFEYAKILYLKKYQEAIVIFHSITETLNADWRAVYRSFYLLHLVYDEIGDKKESSHYAKLCKRCHANFPLL